MMDDEFVKGMIDKNKDEVERNESNKRKIRISLEIFCLEGQDSWKVEELFAKHQQKAHGLAEMYEFNESREAKEALLALQSVAQVLMFCVNNCKFTTELFWNLDPFAVEKFIDVLKKLPFCKNKKTEEICRSKRVFQVTRYDKDCDFNPRPSDFFVHDDCEGDSDHYDDLEGASEVSRFFGRNLEEKDDCDDLPYYNFNSQKWGDISKMRCVIGPLVLFRDSDNSSASLVTASTSEHDSDQQK